MQQSTHRHAAFHRACSCAKCHTASQGLHNMVWGCDAGSKWDMCNHVACVQRPFHKALATVKVPGHCCSAQMQRDAEQRTMQISLHCHNPSFTFSLVMHTCIALNSSGCYITVILHTYTDICTPMLMQNKHTYKRRHNAVAQTMAYRPMQCRAADAYPVSSRSLVTKSRYLTALGSVHSLVSPPSYARRP